AAGVPARIQGSVAVARVAVAEAGKPRLTADRIEASGLVLDWPRRLTAGRLVLSRPRATVERDRSGHVSVTDLFAAPASARPSAPAPRARAARPPPKITATCRRSARPGIG
ncbi:MAG TPA: hypothetical protein VFE14_15870, partial [Micromonosporaceae bacterium]|nr:hypothetical protein [Micromonosporaceae bacterium]